MKSDVIVAWSHGGIPESVKSSFTRPTRFINIPSPKSWKETLAEFGTNAPLRAITAKYAPGVDFPTRFALLGFSASCQGVAQVLGSGDGKYIDAAVAVDGLHVGYVNKKVSEAGMTPWFNFAKLAVVNERLMVVTHSSIVPPGYASTTETAEYLWSRLAGAGQEGAMPPVPPLSMPATTIHVAGGPATGPTRDVAYPTPSARPQRRFNGLVVLGFNNVDGPGTADHVYQAKVVMPAVLAGILAPRWNAIDPEAPGQACYVA
jgi:hypothetical protein